MKTSLVLFLFLLGCSVEPYQGEDESAQEGSQSSTSTEESETISEEYVVNPLKDVCSYNNDPDKGCLKAVIAGANLAVGDFFYEVGPKEFGRSFASDLVYQGYVDLEADETLEFSRRVNERTFYSNFHAAIEGSHSTFAARHTGLGNLQIDNASPGTYDVQLSREFSMRVLDAENKIVSHRCILIWTTETTNVEPGEESALGLSIAEFEMKIFDTSCTGSASTRTLPLEADREFLEEYEADQ